MSVVARPSDAITEDFLLLGLPVIEFGFELSGGGYGAYFGLGIPESAEVQKALQFAQLRNSQSGTSKLVRELVRQFDATIQVTTFRHSGANMQLMFASATLADVADSTPTVTDDPFRLTDNDQVFHDLANQQISEPITGVECAEIAAEDVGTGQGGTFGETLGDFALDFKLNVIGDVSSFTVGGTERVSDLVAGSSPGAGQIGINVGATATSGQIIFPSGEAPASGAALVATYQPTFSFSENTDFGVDYLNGRVRLFSHDQATDELKDFQPMQADYDYTRPAYEEIEPFTQFVFAGRARVRQLTDVASNLIWTIPKCQVRLTEDAFVFNRDDFTVTALALNLLEDDADPTQPYGNLRIYREGTF